MAYKIPVTYNVDSAVGPNAPNQRGDVQLVQFLLREIYNHPTVRMHKPSGEMVVDGWFGPTTARWIVEFQKLVRSKGRPVLVDGRVDPYGEEEYSSISQTIYTIDHLNVTYRRRYRQRHDELENAGLPAPLSAQLRDSAIGAPV